MLNLDNTFVLQLLLIVGLYLIYQRLYLIYKLSHDLLFFSLSLIVSFSLWYVLPILLSNCGYIDIFSTSLSIDLTLEKFNKYALFEIYSYYIVLKFYTKISNYRIRTKYRIVSNGKKIKKIERVFIIYSIIGCLLNLFAMKNYSSLNDISNANNGLSFLGIFISSYLSSYYCANIFCFSESTRNKIFILILVVNNLVSVFIGARIYLLFFVWLYVMNKWKYIYMKKYLRFFSPLIVLLISFSLLLPILAEKRADNESSINKSIVVDLALFHMNLKLNSIAYSTVLIEKDGIGYAGMTPYVGSLLKFVPRLLWTEKPTPLSCDGSVEGMPSRRIPRLAGFSNLDESNVGTTAFIVSLWHGWLGYIITILLNVFYLFTITKLFLSNPFFLKAIGIYLLVFPQLISTPNSGDYLLQRLLEIPIYLFLLIVIGAIKVIKNNNSIKEESIYVSTQIKTKI